MAHQYVDIDNLVRDAVFGDGESRADARRTIHLQARARGAVSSSIFPLYMAIGRGEMPRRFTVPAFNIRALTYDTARALFRAGDDCGHRVAVLRECVVDDLQRRNRIRVETERFRIEATES